MLTLLTLLYYWRRMIVYFIAIVYDARRRAYAVARHLRQLRSVCCFYAIAAAAESDFIFY